MALQGDIFEASHTYRLQGLDRYLTLVEAQGEGGRRYYKAYLAERLDGPWEPLAATRERPFAAPGQRPLCRRGRGPTRSATASCSGPGPTSTLEVDPADLRFLFQGVSDAARRGKPYGEIPWRLGLLTPDPGS